MLNIVESVKEIVKKVHENVTIDGLAFRLYTVGISTVFFIGSLVVTATQFVGKPIECLVGLEQVAPITTFCWVTSTFTVPKLNDKHHIYPGVGPGEITGDDQKFHAYYQWVCFALFLQGVACYAPKWLWDRWEAGLMADLVAGMRHHHLVVNDKDSKRERLLIYLIDHIKQHKLYAFQYWLCEMMCFVNTLVQMYWMNVFFSGEFYSYGLRVLNLMDGRQENRIDPMVYVFPRMTKCTFQKYGQSGSLQIHDALCVLPLNIINEKAYIIIWFLFVISAIVFGFLLCYRSILFFAPTVRSKLLRTNRFVISKRQLGQVVDRIDIGDWWVLYMLGKNINSLVYSKVIADLARKLECVED